MTQYVICALQMEGFHCWPEADGELAYLKNSHRHIFFITAEFPVHNANREIEIISQQNEDTRYLTHYIKNRKPEIDIHLLGCTDVKMIAQNSFCTSADSTSWLSGVKYGWFDDGNQKAHINQFRKDLIEQRLSAVRTITEGRGLELTDKTFLYGARASLCATICKQKYTRAAGSQE